MPILVNNPSVSPMHWNSNLWNVASNADTFNTSSVAISTTPVYSQTFVSDGSNIACMGFLYSLTGTGTTTTITCELQAYSGGTWSTVKTSTIYVDSLTIKSLTNETNNMCLALWDDSGTYAIGGLTYRIKFTGSASGTSTTMSYATGYSSSPAKMMVYPGSKGIDEGSSVFVCGTSSNGTFTDRSVLVTDNDLEIVPVCTSGLNICKGGTINFLNGTSYSYVHTKLGGTLNIYNGGTLNLDGTNSGTKTITLELYDNLCVWDGGSLGMQGYPKFGATPTNFRTILSSTANSGQPNLLCSLNVQSAGWVAGDKVTVQTTDAATANHSEFLTISSVSGNTITLTGNLAYAHLSGAEICNLTRSIKIKNQVYTGNTVYTKNNSYVRTGKTPSQFFDIDYVEFDCKPGSANYSIITNNTGTSNIGAAQTVFNVDNCSFYNTGAASTGFFMSCLNSNVSNLVCYNKNLGGFAVDGGYNGSSSIINSSIVGVQSGTYGIHSTNSTYANSLFCDGLNMYDRSSGTTVGLNGNAVFSYILENCKIFATGNVHAQFQSTDPVLNNCYLGSDGTNILGSMTDIQFSGTNALTATANINNCYLGSSNKVSFTPLYIDNYGMFTSFTKNKPAFNFANYQMTPGSNISYQKWGTISDPATVGYSSAYSYGGSGSCVTVCPNNATNPIFWVFKIEGTASVAETLSMYITKSSNFNGSVFLTVKDIASKVIYNRTEITDIPVNDGVGDDWTLEWSNSITPIVSGNCSVILEVMGTSGAIFVDNISIT